MQNIKFSYLYRDGGNYKRHASVVFSNSDELTVDVVKEALAEAFLPDGLFVARQIRIPEAFLFERGNANSDDHCFHELDSVEVCLETATDVCSRSIGQFVAEVKQQAKIGWTAFDPHTAAGEQLSTRRRTA